MSYLAPDASLWWATARMSDREVLCLGLAAQWRSGVP